MERGVAILVFGVEVRSSREQQFDRLSEAVLGCVVQGRGSERSAGIGIGTGLQQCQREFGGEGMIA